MFTRRTFAIAGATALALSAVIPAAVAAPGGNSATPPGAVRATDTAAYWTPAKRAAAIPRDLAIDGQGRGFIRGAQGWQPYGGSRGPQDPNLIGSSSGPQEFAQQTLAGDVTKPQVTQKTPGNGTTVGASVTFSADVTDNAAVKSVQVVVTFPSGSTRTYSTTKSGNTFSTTLNGFTDGSWKWHVVAKDTSNNTTNTSISPGKWAFTVNTTTGGGGTGGGTGTVAEAAWSGGGNVQNAAGRIFFSMPSNGTNWADYVCSGTAVTDTATNASIILTAAHCVYDDANGVFAKNVLFIPNQAGTTAAGSDRTCSNDPIGCWAPTHGVVDVKYTQSKFPANSPWDYAYYVVPTSGRYTAGISTVSQSLEAAVNELTIQFTQPVSGRLAQAMGYSYAKDPSFRYCNQPLATESAGDWWLSQCGLTGGASGGPWLQGTTDTVTGNEPIISVNSWGYTTGPGMAGPPLYGNSAQCVYNAALASSGDTKVTCP